MKRILKLLVCVSLCIAALTFTYSRRASASSLGGYEITGYDVHVSISEDNVYDVTEVIHARFSEPRHGIYRFIPVNTNMMRQTEHGEIYYTRVPSSVSDVSVAGWDYSVDSRGGEVSIKIGSADELVAGDQTYTISYKIAFGGDGSSDFDEVYYNIIGTEWDATIDNVTFSIELPKAFDAGSIGFSIGPYSSVGYVPEDLDYSVRGNTVTGRMLRPLSYYEGVTMRLGLPDGYFDVPDLRVTDWILMGVMGLLIIISFGLFIKFGIDKKPVETVEYYAPDGLNPAELGYVVDGSVDDKDVVSLLVYWADKGYISIYEGEKGTFEIRKLRNLDADARPFEIQMYNGIFKHGETVPASALTNSFYKTLEIVKKMVKFSFADEDRRVFTQSSIKAAPWVSFFAMFPYIMALSAAFTRMDMGLFFGVIIGIMAGIGFMGPAYFTILLMRGWRGARHAVRKLIIYLAVWAALAAAMALIVSSEAYEPLLPMAAIASSALLSLIAVFIMKRTRQGSIWMGKILGFKNFITLAERDRLEALVEENPSYFYNVLPYAYVLGVTDKWIGKFETIAVPPPDWYYGHSTFTPVAFAASINSVMSTFSTQMSSSPSSSGGGGGGGSSGGGGGGGGGGSW